MLDSFLNWFSIAIPFLVSVGAVLITLKLPHERHYKKYVAGSAVIGLFFSGMIWWQQIRAAEHASEDRGKAIDETVAKISKENESKFAEQNQKIDALQAALDKTGKDVNTIGQSPFISGKNPVKVEVTNLEIANSVEDWPPLSRNEKIGLVRALKLLHSQSIVVACETPKCKKLADDLNTALRDSGWNSNVMHSGGLGITGTTGITLNPGESGTKGLKEAIEKTTKLKINLGTDSRKEWGNIPALLVVGTRPF